MPHPPKVIAFDIDLESGSALRHAFPDWEIIESHGATPASLARDWDPDSAVLLVMGARADPGETLGLCRSLRSQAGRAHASVLVLLDPVQEGLVKAVLDAGANSCLMLPVHPKDLVNVVSRPRDGNSPGRHTLSRDRAQKADVWQDCGGES